MAIKFVSFEGKKQAVLSAALLSVVMLDILGDEYCNWLVTIHFVETPFISPKKLNLFMRLNLKTLTSINTLLDLIYNFLSEN